MNKKTKEVDFRDRKLVFMDFEMTGLNPEIHEVIEVGCLVVNPKTFQVEKEYYSKVKPEHLETAVKKALKIGGYSDSEWQDAKPAKKVFKEIGSLSPGAIPAGWCINKDYSFLYSYQKRLHLKESFDYHLLDVYDLAYQYFFAKSKPTELSLRRVCEELGINISDKHDAMGDIKATYEVFVKLRK